MPSDATASIQPLQGSGSTVFGDFNPQSIFGSNYQQPKGYGGPWQAGGESSYGSGLQGLPNVFRGWRGASRFAFAPVSQYAQQLQPALNLYQQQMGQNTSSQLFGLAQGAMESQFQDAARQRDEGLNRAGYGGGSTVSPLASMALQSEAQARAGAFGPAAQQAVIQSQALQTEAARNYQNAISSLLQAWLVPSQLQTTSQAKAPTGTVGPSLIGPGLNALGGLLNAYSASQ